MTCSPANLVYIVPVMLFDTHAHLVFDPKTDDPEGDLARAREAGVAHFAAVGTDVSSCEAALQLASRHDDVCAILGIHPHEADRAQEGDLTRLEQMLSEPCAAALGETGLDYYRDYADRDRQKALFTAQLALAKRLQAPVILHVREAHADALGILEKESPPGWTGIAHCFSGSAEDAQRYLALGFLVSFSGTLTYPNALGIRALASELPLEGIVLETDCPFLAPQPVRGKRNEPAYLVHTARALAELRGISLEELARATTRNAIAVFRLAGKGTGRQ